MSFAEFKKQLNKTSQYLSEKVGGNKGSEADEDFVELERTLDVMNYGVEQMLENTNVYLQPNPTARTKLAAQASYQKVRGQAKSGNYPQPEFNLADVFSRVSNGLHDDSGYSSVLAELGAVFNQLSEIKDSMEFNVKQNFLDPLYGLQQKDLREIGIHRKNLESRRLDYDYKKGKGAEVPEEELAVAEDKFTESKQLCYNSMMNFIDSDVEHLGQFHAFSEAIRDYHKQCADVMESVTESIDSKITEAASRPRTERHTYDMSNANESNKTKQYVGELGEGVEVQQSPYAVALYAFVPENEGELKFGEGDMIKLTSRLDENWLEGSCNGRSGYFPVNYVVIKVPL